MFHEEHGTTWLGLNQSQLAALYLKHPSMIIVIYFMTTWLGLNQLQLTALYLKHLNMIIVIYFRAILSSAMIQWTWLGAIASAELHECNHL